MIEKGGTTSKETIGLSSTRWSIDNDDIGRSTLVDTIKRNVINPLFVYCSSAACSPIRSNSKDWWLLSNLSCLIAITSLMSSHQSKRLRHLTQAYLFPPQFGTTQNSQTPLGELDRIYDFGMFIWISFMQWFTVEKFIVENQNATTGLFPRYSNNKSIAYVKDSIYCALACWACSNAYQRLDDDRGR